MKTERGPWRRLSYEAAQGVRCYRPDCSDTARWTRTWRTKDMGAPAFEHSCRRHAEGLVEQLGYEAGAQEEPGSGPPARSSPGRPPSFDEEGT